MCMGDLIGILFGIALMVFGVFMFAFFPGTKSHQGDGFAVLGVVVGIVSFFVGLVLIVF